MIVDLGGVLLLIAGLLALNGMFVSSEFSLLGSPRAQLEPLARRGSRAARGVLALAGNLRSLDRSLTTAQIGITLVSLGLGMYGEHALVELAVPWVEGWGSWSAAASHGIATAGALGILTFVHIVLAEQLPKAIALQYPLRTALWVQGPIRLTMLALAPLIFVMDRLSAGILRLLRVPAEGHSRSHTVEEIESLIQESAGGIIGARQAEVMLNLLDLRDLMVRKLMVPRIRVVGLDVTATPEEVLATLARTRHTRIPVYEVDLDHVLGFVHAKDLIGLFDDEAPFDLRRVLRPVPNVPETALARNLLHELRRHRTQLAVVLDEHGGTAGIATLEDLVEEIFGDVQDEYDTEKPGVEKLSGAEAIVDGALRLDEVNAALGLRLPEGEVDTLAGLVLQELGRTARPGDKVRVDGVKLEVISVRGLAVARVRVVKPPVG